MNKHTEERKRAADWVLHYFEQNPHATVTDAARALHHERSQSYQLPRGMIAEIRRKLKAVQVQVEVKGQPLIESKVHVPTLTREFLGIPDRPTPAERVLQKENEGFKPTLGEVVKAHESGPAAGAPPQAAPDLSRIAPTIRKANPEPKPGGFSIADVKRVMEKVKRENGVEAPPPPVPKPKELKKEIKEPEWAKAPGEEVNNMGILKPSELKEDLRFLKLPEEGVRSQVMNVTPQMAAKWLESNSENRTLSQARVDAYAADMRAGRWKLNNQGIAFGKDGILYDGQHRLWAIVESGVTVPMLVVRGLSPEARSTIDKLRPRQVADDLKMLTGMKNTSALVARVKALAALVAGTERNKPLSYGQVMEWMEKYRAGLDFVMEAYPGGGKLGIAPVMGAIALAYRKFPEEVKRFTERYLKGTGLEEGDPELHLRNLALMGTGPGKSKPHSLIIGKKALTAIAKAMDGRKIARLDPNESEVKRFM